MAPKENSYDFIVVGAGPAGCTVAARLAESEKAPSVLLIEAGGANADKNLRVDADRWTTFLNPGLNWGYETTPQPGLNGRKLDYSRGKGLSGSSAINFSFYDIGPRDDFDEIARIAEDPSWSWKYAQTRLKNIEAFHPEVPEGHQEYVKPQPEDHGTNGKLHVGFPRVWERSLSTIFKMLRESGFQFNLDVNSGDPIGWAAAPNSAYDGVRSTSADLLVGPPDNLKIVTGSFVHRVIFDGIRAIGVETEGGSHYAAREVILSCGAIDTPKLLMLSGIGNSSELDKLQIPVVQDIQAVGKGLSDHLCVQLLYRRTENGNDRSAYFRSPEAMESARKQWQIDQTGPLAEIGVGFAVGFLKSEKIYASKEFRNLSPDRRRHLNAATVPLYEFILNVPDMRDYMDPTQSEATFPLVVFMLNGESRGEVLLQTANPKDVPTSNPNFFSHSFDQRVAIDATRYIMEIMELPPFAKDTIGIIQGPKSKSDDDILEFWREKASSSFHMTGTVKLGTKNDPTACVDHDLRVFGTKSLRVADMSVLPILPNNHTQTSAYYVGATMGDKLVAEYKLDEAAVKTEKAKSS